MGSTKTSNHRETNILGKRIGKHYYDHPEGEDLLGKLVYTSKISGAAGWIWGLLKVLNENPVTFRERMFLCVKPSSAGIGMAIAFTATTFLATNLRKKDDELNYILGGLAAGGVFGTLTSATSGFYACVAFTFCGCLKKNSIINNYQLHPPIGPQIMSNYFRTHFSDTSLTAERKGNWSRELPPQ